MLTKMAEYKYQVDAKEITLGLVKNPVVYLRASGLVFSIVVFGCLADKGYAIARGGDCLINDSAACDIGIAAGVVGMVMCLGFFAIDVLYIILKQNKIRGILLLIDASAYTLWGIFWFISFCYTVHHWDRVDSDDRSFIEDAYGQSTINNILAAIAFTSFNVIVWGIIVLLDFLFVIRGPGFPCNPKPDDAPSPREDGYASFPNQDESNGSYQPPEL